ncbi:MAG: GNAT family N-acetyltransferase [Flavobacterium sp.]
MKIQKYEDWMRPQVVALFDLEYSTGEEQFDSLFRAFYEHPFQVEKCIRIVAVEGEQVAGFQSFFYWPLMIKGVEVKSYQSGNSLVHPDFRGKGLFGKMLNFIHEPENGFECELLIGFPVEASYNSFMRNQWLNPFNLQWYVKPMNPGLSLFSNPDPKLKKALGERIKMSFDTDHGIVHVGQSARFDDYRFAYEQGNFYRYVYEAEGKKAWFEMKSQVRKRVIRELVIGKFLVSHDDPKFIQEALQALAVVVKKSASYGIMSIAINPLTESLRRAVEACGFRRIDKQIYFIAKGKLATDNKDWSDWWMFRSDIDTW